MRNRLRKTRILFEQIVREIEVIPKDEIWWHNNLPCFPEFVQKIPESSEIGCIEKLPQEGKHTCHESESESECECRQGTCAEEHQSDLECATCTLTSKLNSKENGSGADNKLTQWQPSEAIKTILDQNEPEKVDRQVQTMYCEEAETDDSCTYKNIHQDCKEVRQNSDKSNIVSAIVNKKHPEELPGVLQGIDQFDLETDQDTCVTCIKGQRASQPQIQSSVLESTPKIHVKEKRSTAGYLSLHLHYILKVKCNVNTCTM